VDETRNVLYSLSQTDFKDYTGGQTLIEVIDLGIFGGEFSHVVTLNQYEIIYEFLKQKDSTEF